MLQLKLAIYNSEIWMLLI